MEWTWHNTLQQKSIHSDKECFFYVGSLRKLEKQEWRKRKEKNVKATTFIRRDTKASLYKKCRRERKKNETTKKYLLEQNYMLCNEIGKNGYETIQNIRQNE